MERLAPRLDTTNETQPEVDRDSGYVLYENPFSLSSRRSGRIQLPKAPEKGPEEDHRVPRFVLGRHQERTKGVFPIRLLALRVRVEQTSNSVSYLPVPKLFTASPGHARQRYARPLLLPPLFRTRVVSVRITKPRGSGIH